MAVDVKPCYTGIVTHFDEPSHIYTVRVDTVGEFKLPLEDLTVQGGKFIKPQKLSVTRKISQTVCMLIDIEKGNTLLLFTTSAEDLWSPRGIYEFYGIPMSSNEQQDCLYVNFNIEAITENLRSFIPMQHFLEVFDNRFKAQTYLALNYGGEELLTKLREIVWPRINAKLTIPPNLAEAFEILKTTRQVPPDLTDEQVQTLIYVLRKQEEQQFPDDEGVLQNNFIMARNSKGEWVEVPDHGISFDVSAKNNEEIEEEMQLAIEASVKFLDARAVAVKTPMDEDRVDLTAEDDENTAEDDENTAEDGKKIDAKDEDDEVIFCGMTSETTVDLKLEPMHPNP